MDKKEKTGLRNQLAAQAELFVSEEDPMQLLSAVLVSCRGLFHAAERLLPELDENTSLETAAAGYLSSGSMIMAFLNTYNNRLSKSLAGHLQSLSETQTQTQELRTQNKEQDEANQVAEKELQDEQKLKDELAAKKTELEQRRTAYLKAKEELSAATARCENYEALLRELSESAEAAEQKRKDLLDDIPAHERLCDGFRKEGYVDIDSYLAAVKELDAQLETLSVQYNQLISPVINDLNEIYRALDARQKGASA